MGTETILPRFRRPWRACFWITAATVSLLGFVWLHNLAPRPWHPVLVTREASPVSDLPFGRFPVKGDPFQFLPCTNASILPSLDDKNPKEAWKAVFDTDHENWTWGSTEKKGHKSYDGRGIYMCGYLDVPLDHLNSKKDKRIVRLAVTKFQVSGLARKDSSDASAKSKRTIVINPGGPGVSGTKVALETGEKISKIYSEGKFDVLGWDPRGVNTSLPTMSCFPHNAMRDRWRLLPNQYRATVDPKKQFQIADAMNNATFHACWKQFGDFGRFLSTASVARDLEEIREALGEKELTAYLISYGTAIGQTYANMFPDKVGRMILDGNLFIKDERLLGGFGWSILENATDAWHDGFLGECVKAGPKQCALAKPIGDSKGPVTVKLLEARLTRFLDSLIDRPISAYAESIGPSIVTYSDLVDLLLVSLYDPSSWPRAAQMLYELERGNATLAATLIDKNWGFNPAHPSPHPEPFSPELLHLVTCADAYIEKFPDGIADWPELWERLIERSWLAGNSRFHFVSACANYKKYWSSSENYKGDLDTKLNNPLLLISTTYDPATPLSSGRKLLKEMGKNARLIVHDGYGHTSAGSRSKCTDKLGRAFIVNGTLPSKQETECSADEKPYSQHQTEISSSLVGFYEP